MNGRIFFASVVINSAKTVGQNVGGSRIGEPCGPKSGGGLGPSGPIGVFAYGFLVWIWAGEHARNFRPLT